MGNKVTLKVLYRLVDGLLYSGSVTFDVLIDSIKGRIIKLSLWLRAGFNGWHGAMNNRRPALCQASQHRASRRLPLYGLLSVVAAGVVVVAALVTGSSAVNVADVSQPSGGSFT